MESLGWSAAPATADLLEFRSSSVRAFFREIPVSYRSSLRGVVVGACTAMLVAGSGLLGLPVQAEGLDGQPAQTGRVIPLASLLTSAYPSSPAPGMAAPGAGARPPSPP